MNEIEKYSYGVYSFGRNTTLEQRLKFFIEKMLKKTRTVVYIVQVENIFKCRKHHFSLLAQR